MKIFSKPRIPILLFIVFFALGMFLINWSSRNVLTLVIDAKISASDSFEVYFNEDVDNPIREPIYLNIRHRYAFEGVPSHIERLRVDPTNQVNTQVEIYGIEIRQGESLLQRIEPAELLKWEIYGGSATLDSQTGALHIHVTQDPSVRNSNLQFNSDSGLLSVAPAKILKSSLLWFVMGGLFATAIFSGSLFQALILVCIGLVGFAVYQEAFEQMSLEIHRLGELPDVSKSVGFAAFFGISKQSEYRAHWAALLRVLLFALVGGAIWRLVGSVLERFSLFTESASSDTKATSNEQGSKHFSLLYFLLIVLVIAISEFPNLSMQQQILASTIHNADYDSQNFVTWQHFLHLGLQLYRDVWYPYSAFYYLGFGTLYPAAKILLLGYLNHLFLWTVFAIGIYHTFNYSKAWTAAVLALVSLLFCCAVLDAFDRYFLSISVLLTFAMALDSRSRTAFFCWGAFCSYVFVMEAVQLGYAAVPCFVLLVSQVIGLSKNLSTRELLKFLSGQLLWAILSFGALTGLFLLWLYQVGALAEYIRFYKIVGSLANFSLLPAEIVSWFRYPRTTESWLYFLLLALPLLSILQCFTRSKAVTPIARALPLAIAILTLVIFQKQLVRPHMASQILMFPIIGLFVLTHNYLRIVRPADRPVVTVGLVSPALFSGAVFQLLILSYGAVAGKDWIGQVVEHVTGLPANLRVAFLQEEEWKRIESRYFSPEAFQFSGNSTPDASATVSATGNSTSTSTLLSGVALASKLNQKLALSPDDDIYVLSDDPFLYIILNRLGPRHISLYSQSIIDSQDETVNWLNDRKPKYVIWRSSATQFDGFPYAVRVPLVFRAVTEQYVPFGEVLDFTLLRRREANEPIDFAFWRAKLGPVCDLGYIPSRSNLKRPASVSNSKGSYQYPVLLIRVDRPRQGRVREVPVVVGDDRYAIKFIERSKVTHYAINLDRIWFWTAGNAARLNPKILDLGRDAKTTTVLRGTEQEQLY